MKKPNIIALPTSQMEVFCDFFNLPYERGDTIEAIKALEEVPQSEWTKLKVGQDTRAAETVDADIVEARKAKMGVSDQPEE